MKFERMFAVLLRQLYLIRGSLTRVLPLFIWVVIDIVLWGYITKYLNEVGPASHNFVPQMLGSVVMWDFFIRILQGVTLAFLEDVWSRNFLNIFATPLTLADYLGGLVLSTIVTSIVGVAAMLILAVGIFDLPLQAYGLALAPYVLTLFFFGIAIGVLGCALVLRWGPAAEWFIWPIPAIIAPFAGVFYPLSVLPHWMQLLSVAVPPAYVFEGMRAILAGHPMPLSNLFLSIALSLLAVWLACLLFARVYRHALKTGLIARYSAETLD